MLAAQCVVVAFLVLIQCSLSTSQEASEDRTAKSAWSVFSTEGHPKAKGLRVQIKYPSNWQSKEGDRPDIVQKFVERPTGGPLRMAVLMVVAGRPARLAYLPERALPDALASLSEADFAAMCPVSARLLSGKATRYDGEPGVCVSYTLDQELAGLSFRTVFLQHTVFWRERAVVLQCGVGDVPESEEMQAAFEDAKPTFTLMGASIVLLDKWEGEQAEGVGDAGAISSGDRVRGLGREQQHLGIRIIGQLIGMLIGAAIGSLLGAVVLQIATHWACKFRPPYGMAYKACFLVWAPSFVLGYATGFALGGAGVRLGWAGIIALEAVGVFFGAAIYGALLKHPDSRRSIGFGKGCVVSLFVLFVRVLILLAAIMVARMVTLDWPW